MWSHNKGKNTKWLYRGEIGVALIEEKIIENRLRWFGFGHVQKRPQEGTMRKVVCMF